MNPEKVAAERDCLLQALKRAEEEIARARTAQQLAEGRLAEMRARSGAAAPSARNDIGQAAMAQARAAVDGQKRAETMAQTLDEQFRRQKVEHDKLRAAFDGLKGENEGLRDQIEELQEKLKEREQQAAPTSTPASRAEQKSLRDELDAAWVEIQRLRTLVVKVASEARKGIVPGEVPSFPPSNTRTLPSSRPSTAASVATPQRSAATPPRSGAGPARSSKADVDCGPKSNARQAA